MTESIDEQWRRDDFGDVKADQLRRTSEIIQRHLDRVARLPDPRARREALFELWDEAIESGDAAHVEAGRAARLRVLGVIAASRRCHSRLMTERARPARWRA